MNILDSLRGAPRPNDNTCSDGGRIWNPPLQFIYIAKPRAADRPGQMFGKKVFKGFDPSSSEKVNDENFIDLTAEDFFANEAKKPQECFVYFKVLRRTVAGKDSLFKQSKF